MPNITNYNVECTDCENVVTPEGPKYETHLKVAGSLLLGVLGLGIGATFGVVTAGFGATLMFPLAGLGLFFGYFGGAWAARMHDNINCPECGSKFGGLVPGL